MLISTASSADMDHDAVPPQTKRVHKSIQSERKANSMEIDHCFRCNSEAPNPATAEVLSKEKAELVACGFGMSNQSNDPLESGLP